MREERRKRRKRQQIITLVVCALVLAALKKAAGFVRHELGQSMIIRYAPEILFEEDHNIEYGIHIASVLKQVRSEEETNDESSDGQE